MTDSIKEKYDIEKFDFVFTKRNDGKSSKKTILYLNKKQPFNQTEDPPEIRIDLRTIINRDIRDVERGYKPALSSETDSNVYAFDDKGNLYTIKLEK